MIRELVEWQPNAETQKGVDIAGQLQSGTRGLQLLAGPEDSPVPKSSFGS